MRKKNFFVLNFIFLCLYSSYSIDLINDNKMPKMDVVFRAYLPSVLGIVCGTNGYLTQNEAWEFNSSINIMLGCRGDIVSLEKVSFSWATDFSSNIAKDDNLVFAMALGGGLYFHPWGIKKLMTLKDFFIFFYPAYKIPIFFRGEYPQTKWQIAMDMGYSFLIRDIFTIDPYVRTILGLSQNASKFGFDAGVALCIYFKDFNYH